MENYIELAGKTNNTDFDSVRERVNKQDFLNYLYKLMVTSKWSTDNLDIVKKYMYYGKGEETIMRNISLLQYRNNFEDIELSDELIDLLHGVIGVYTEAGEMLEAMIAHVFKRKELDVVNLAEEVSDVFWYCALILERANMSFSEVQKMNIDKLKKRYPEGFKETDAIERDIEAEREILENAVNGEQND